MLFFTFFSIFSFSQIVSDVNSKQIQNSIIVSYQLETSVPCKISLFFSNNDGQSWIGPLTKVTGDVGDNVKAGFHNITWSVLEEYAEFIGDNIKFKVESEISKDLFESEIGTQHWQIRNLDVSTYRNGDIIPQVQGGDQWSNLTTGAWCYYENNEKNGQTYGKLYNWYAVNDPRGLAPVGYHIPSKSEWRTLVNYLGGDDKAFQKMKSSKGWKFNCNGNNSDDFDGKPGGCRVRGGSFSYIGFFTGWWSSTESSNGAWFHKVDCENFEKGGDIPYDKKYGFSVRCIRD